MTTLQIAIEKRIAEAREATVRATAKGDFATASFNDDLRLELQNLLDRTASAVDVTELDADDASRIADFIEANEEAFVEFLLARRVSLAGRHSLNLMNQLRGH